MSTKRYELPSVPSGWNAKDKIGIFCNTYSCFRPDETKSALQKSIRRGKTTEAYQWALEMFKSNPHLVSNCWNRLLIICVEDIGPANPSLVLQVYELMTSGKLNYNHLLHAVKLMARSEKTRVNDWALHISRNLTTKTPEGPFFGYISLLRNTFMNDFNTSLYCIVRLLKWPMVDKEKESSQGAIERIWKFVFEPKNKFMRMLETLTLKYVKKYTKDHPFPEFSILLTMHAFHIYWHLGQIKYIKMDPITDAERIKYMQINNDHTNRTNLIGMPDYALDKHTHRGAAMGRDIIHFLMCGGVLRRESIFFKPLDDAYVDLVKRYFISDEQRALLKKHECD